MNSTALQQQQMQETCGYGANHTGDSHGPVLGCSFVSLPKKMLVFSPSAQGFTFSYTHPRLLRRPQGFSRLHFSECQTPLPKQLRFMPPGQVVLNVIAVQAVTETPADSVKLVIMDKVGLIKNNELCGLSMCQP